MCIYETEQREYASESRHERQRSAMAERLRERWLEPDDDDENDETEEN
jgi:hypothetical protein